MIGSKSYYQSSESESMLNKKLIVLYSEGNNHWNYVKPVADFLIKNVNTIPSIFITEQWNDIGLKYIKNIIPTFVVGSGRIRDYVINNISCEIFLTTSPDLDNFQIKRSPRCNHYA